MLEENFLKDWKSRLVHPNIFDLFIMIEYIDATKFEVPLSLINFMKDRIDLIPHQIIAVKKMIDEPLCRFLLADDLGLGKTIMAGMLIKELLFKGRIKNVLIIVPPMLIPQWKSELEEKFNLKFLEFTSAMPAIGELLVASIDFLKQGVKESRRKTRKSSAIDEIINRKWDLIIFDEAHKLSAYMDLDKTEIGTRRIRENTTLRYKLAKKLVSQTKYVLLLTATPHTGRNYQFYKLVSLITPYFLVPVEEKLNKEFVEKAIPVGDFWSEVAEWISPAHTLSAIDDNVWDHLSKNSMNILKNFVIRRMKSEVIDFDGKRIFKDRKVLLEAVELDDPHQNLYSELIEYIKNEFNLIATAEGDIKRGVSFALIVLVRRLLSSSYALRKTLERRKEALKNLKKILVEISSSAMPEEDLKKIMKRHRNYLSKLISVINNYYEGSLDSENFDSELSIIFPPLLGEAYQEEVLDYYINCLEEEIKTIEKLLGDIDSLPPMDPKEKKLLEIIRRHEGEKIIIFTEYKDTLERLREVLEKELQDKIIVIHGDMTFDERKRAIEAFKDEANILIATDVAGEGLNLQFAHIMVNYELTWSPIKLEQRAGRLHRYGQTRDVIIYNLYYEKTLEDKVLATLIRKILKMAKIFGDRIYDVIGTAINEALKILGYRYGSIEEIATQYILNPERALEDIDRIMKATMENVKKTQEREREITDAWEIKREILENISREINNWIQKAFDQKDLELFAQKFFEWDGKNTPWEIVSKSEGVICIKTDDPDRAFKSLDDLESYFIAGPLNRSCLFFSNKDKERLKSLRKEKYKSFYLFDVDFALNGKKVLDLLCTEVITRIKTKGLDPPLVSVKTDDDMNGVVGIFVGESKTHDNKVIYKKLIALYYDTKNQKIYEISPKTLWRKLQDHTNIDEALDLNTNMEQIIEKLTLDAKRTIQEDFSKFKKKLNRKIREYDNLIENYLDQLEEAIKIQTDFYDKQGQKAMVSRLEGRLEQIREDIRYFRAILRSVCNPNIREPEVKLIGILIVKPKHGPTEKISKSTKQNLKKQVEREAIKAAIEFERKNGRQPADVSHKNIGYDIISHSHNEVRYIEVKGFKEIPKEIEITIHEWNTASQLKEKYWLYIVLYALNPQKRKIITIRNPYEKLSKETMTKLIKIKIKLDTILKHSNTAKTLEVL